MSLVRVTIVVLGYLLESRGTKHKLPALADPPLKQTRHWILTTGPSTFHAWKTVKHQEGRGKYEMEI